jgi:DNA repair photolyase
MMVKRLEEMEERKIDGKAIYSTRGAAREYGRVGCNFYTGCPHDCAYCYLKRGAPSKVLGGTQVKLKKCFKDEERAFDVFCKEAWEHMEYLKEVGVFLSFTTDPMIEETINLTIWVVEFCVEHNIPIKVLTKNAKSPYAPYMGILFEKILKVEGDVRFGFTLTGRDDMERLASSNDERVEAMKFLKEQGMKTFASIEPVIDWESSMNIIKKALPYCDHFKIGLRSGVKKDYYDDSEIIHSISWLKHVILGEGKTLYFKESIRKRACEVMGDNWLTSFLKGTLDMDGNLIS